MKRLLKHSITSVILRFFLQDSTSTTGAGKTGLTSASAGLVISTLASNEASPTVYTAAGSTVEGITTIGTYAAPTATKCRFKEVDATNHPGLYEVQLADTRFAVTGARNLIISILATGVAPVYGEIELVAVDLLDATAFGLSRLDAAISSRHASGAAVASVTGNVGGNVTGSVGSVASFGTLVADIATAVWAAATRTLTAISDSSGVTTLLSRLTGGRATNLDNLDATVSSRLAASGYTAPTTPPTVTQIRQEMDTNSTKLDVAVGTRLAGSAYTAPLDAAGTRTALGMNAADLDTQLDAILAASGGGGGSDPEAIAEALATRVLEGSTTWEQAFRGMAAVAMGKSSNNGATYRDLADTKNRIVATVSSGARTAVTRDLD